MREAIVTVFLIYKDKRWVSKKWLKFPKIQLKY